MRTFEFRAWDNDMRDWAWYGNRPHRLDEISEDGLYVGDTSFLTVITQYTGVYDINRVQVCEGDIVRVQQNLTELIPEYTGVVEWDKFMFTIRTLDIEKLPYTITPLTPLDTFGLDLCVIGNIFEEV